MRSRPEARPCATMPAPMAGSGAFSTDSRSIAARASRAQEKAAEEPYAASSREDAPPFIVQPVNARGTKDHHVLERLHCQGAGARSSEKERRLCDDHRLIQRPVSY